MSVTGLPKSPYVTTLIHVYDESANVTILVHVHDGFANVTIGCLDGWLTTEKWDCTTKTIISIKIPHHHHVFGTE